VIAWVIFHYLQKRGILIPAEILGGAADIVFDLVFGAGALLFRWLGNKVPKARDNKR